VARGADRRRCEREAKCLFGDFSFQSTNDFSGVSFCDLPKIEDFLKINMTVYELDGGTAKLVHHSRGVYEENIMLNVYKNHTRESFPGGLYKAKNTVFDKFSHIDIDVADCDRFYFYIVCFDFECFLTATIYLLTVSILRLKLNTSLFICRSLQTFPAIRHQPAL